MAPLVHHDPLVYHQLADLVARNVTAEPTRSSLSIDGDILEAWAEGFYVGSLIILVLIVLCNIRSGILLHKLILLEMFLAIWHGTFIFCQDPVFGWYLSSTATLLFFSYQLHNVISWIKIKRFLPRWGSRLFIGSIIAVSPFWIVETWSNWEYFNGLGSSVNNSTRPWEALARDPWWIFTTLRLVWAIKRNYSYKLSTLFRNSPRFGIMILCMFLSIVFLLTDVVVSAAHLTADSGINPYWRLALVFKCASDTIFLDDFKSVLDNIVEYALRKAGGAVSSGQRRGSNAVNNGRKKNDNLDATWGSRSRSKSPAINVTPLEEREMNDLHPTTTVTVAQPNTGRVKWGGGLFPKREDPTTPKMEIRRDITISTSHQERKRSNSVESFNSKERFLSQPERTYEGDSNGYQNKIVPVDSMQGAPR
ncbi:hypothetical protein MMC13_004519 [Lambiella insularis]|nr:hypothetical protein [Lambiella insularis]